eukprot:g35495.t1
MVDWIMIEGGAAATALIGYQVFQFINKRKGNFAAAKQQFQDFIDPSFPDQPPPPGSTGGKKKRRKGFDEFLPPAFSSSAGDACFKASQKLHKQKHRTR